MSVSNKPPVLSAGVVDLEDGFVGAGFPFGEEASMKANEILHN